MGATRAILNYLITVKQYIRVVFVVLVKLVQHNVIEIVYESKLITSYVHFIIELVSTIGRTPQIVTLKIGYLRVS